MANSFTTNILGQMGTNVANAQPFYHIDPMSAGGALVGRGFFGVATFFWQPAGIGVIDHAIGSGISSGLWGNTLNSFHLKAAWW
jgi:hypothetical protein